MKLTSLLARFVLVVAVLPALSAALASLTGALLQGTVQDSAGGVIGGAIVIMRNDATGTEQRTRTDNAGRYIFSDLSPAGYTLRVEASGFKSLERRDLVLSVGQQTDLNLVLQVGSNETTVEVKGEIPLLNSASPALGQVIDNRQITQLPLLNRQVLNLSFLVPGVLESGDSLFGGPGGGFTGIDFSSNGQRNSSTDVLLDGAIIAPPEPGQGSGQNELQYSPTPDAVEEFKIQNNSFSAEFGSNGGTVINIISKSGTNQFHGSGYWFSRRPAFDAVDFYSNRAGNGKPDYERDQYGGSFGGPIIKQRAFFFFDFDKVRLINSAIINETVPTQAERQGDFSQIQSQIYNPFSNHPIVDSSGNIIDYQRDPLPGNKIPQNLIDPVAAKTIALYPAPTSTGDAQGFNNFTKTELSNQPAWQLDARVDYNLSDKSRLTGRYSFHHDTMGLANNIYGNAANPDQGTQTDRINNAVLEETYTLNATTVLTILGALNRVYSVRFSDPFDVTSVGWPSLLTQGGYKIFPQINISNYAPLGGQNCVDTVANTTLPQYSASIDKIKGAHNLKAGYLGRIFLDNFGQPCVPAGQFSFSNAPTTMSVFNPSGGNSMASYLMGTVDGGSLAIAPAMPTKSTENAFYFQDDWRLSSRLTANLGLRYEWSTPYTDRFNRIQIANFTESSGVSVPGLGNLAGVLDFQRQGHQLGRDWNNLAPRAGFAYSVRPSTVLRAGAGVYYNNNPATNNYLTGPSFSGDTAVNGSLDGGVTRNASLSNPFPTGLVYPQGTAYGKLAQWGLAGDAQTEYDFRNGEIYQWNAGFQHQFPGDMVVEANYSGSRSHHLPLANFSNRNYVSAATRNALGSAGLNQQVANPFYSLFQGAGAVINEPASIYNNASVSQINLVRPYPQFPGAFSGWTSGRLIGDANYNAFQIRIEKRYSHGLNFQANYTYARTYDNGPGSNIWLGGFYGFPQDPGNVRGEWSPGSADAPQRFVSNASYELPFGHGKLIGGNLGRKADLAVGGWQINSILSFQSGFPLHVYMTNGRLADGQQRPQLTGNPRSSISIHDVAYNQSSFYNPAAFSDPGDQQPGNAPRYDGQLRGDGIRNLDTSLFKNFHFTEQKTLEVRAEFFNFTNTPRFATPDSGFGDPTFGQIFGQYNTGRRTQLGARFVF